MPPGIGDVDVTDLPATRLFNATAIGIDPRQIAQPRFAGESLHEHFARAFHGRFVIYGEKNRFVGESLKGSGWLLRRVEWQTVHGEEIIALLYVNARLS